MHLPRFGKEYKMYEKVLPSMELDISYVLSGSEYRGREGGGKLDSRCILWEGAATNCSGTFIPNHLFYETNSSLTNVV